MALNSLGYATCQVLGLQVCSVTPGWTVLAGEGRHVQVEESCGWRPTLGKPWVEGAGSPGQSLHQLLLKHPVYVHIVWDSVLQHCSAWDWSLHHRMQGSQGALLNTDELVHCGVSYQKWLPLGEPEGSLAAMSLPTESVQWPSAPLYSIMCLSFTIEWLS